MSLGNEALAIGLAAAFVGFFMVAAFTAMVLNWRDDRRSKR